MNSHNFREVQNVLTFSIGAAEQNMLETQQAAVVKLRESRAKRLQQLEDVVRKRLREIDIRSAEVNHRTRPPHPQPPTALTLLLSLLSLYSSKYRHPQTIPHC